MRLILLALTMLIMQEASAQVSPHGRLKIECEACHGTDSWAMKDNATFKHETVGFVLTGQHEALKCIACHDRLKFGGLDSRCQSCHVDVHKGELATNCLRCHTTQSWHISDILQKHERTRFPLLGRHSSVTCESCHIRTSEHEYIGTPTECVSCHRSAFQSARNPDHVQARFSTDCLLCHEVNAVRWGGSFDHALTAFPLTGAHRATRCASCHQSQNFAATSSECISCHQSQFDGTTSPNHITANFGRDCRPCHSTTAWRPAVFNHDQQYFRIYSGKHRNKWVGCVDCHQTPANYGSFTCFGCHQHRQSAMDSKHASVSGYAYSSPRCYNCHRGV